MSDNVLISIPRYGTLPANIYNDKNYVTYISNLQADLKNFLDMDFGLLDELMSTSVLSDEEIADIRCEKTVELMAERMLGLLCTVYTDRVGKFMAGLQRTEQLHIFNYIIHNGVLTESRNGDIRPLSEEHLARINASSRYLIDFVVPDVTFVNELLTAGVITSRHKQHVDVGNTSSERNKRILEILRKRSVSNLKSYANCLTKTRQGHLVPLLTQDTATAKLHASLNGSLVDRIDETESEIVNEFELVIRENNVERDELDVSKINDAIKRLGERTQLIALRKQNGIDVYVLCLVLESLQLLRDTYNKGQLTGVVETVFTLLLKDRRPVHVAKLEWTSLNYDECVQSFPTTPGWTFSPKIKDKPAAVKVSYVSSSLSIELLETVLLKAAFFQLRYRMKLTSHADHAAMTSLNSVCRDWWNTITGRQSNRRQLRRLYRQTCLPYQCHPKSQRTPPVFDGSTVRGVARLGDRLYFACRQSDAIQVFSDHLPFDRHDDIRVSGLSWPRDVAACPDTGRLFITDSRNKCVFRVDVTAASVSRAARWLGSKPVPYSVSVSRRRVVVTPNIFFGSTLAVFDCDDGKLIRSVRLPDFMEPRHSVETDRGSFIVCHTGRGVDKHDQVSEINTDGIVVRAFGGQRGGAVDMMRFPRSVMIDDDGRVLVADSGNYRVLLLDSELGLERVLLNRDDSGLDGEPNRLCYISRTGQLVVGLRSNSVRMYSISAKY